MKINWSQWNALTSLSSLSYLCGYCGNNIGTNHGYYHNGVGATIYICTYCGCPTFFYGVNQYPGPQLGRTIKNLPQDIDTIYQEIRDSIKTRNFTAAELLGRKLIMHLAVDVAGAKEGETFFNYVVYLKTKGYIPPNGDKWINYVKKLGNEKNHEIKVGNKEEAEKILKFIEILLIFIYEFSNEIEEEKK